MRLDTAESRPPSYASPPAVHPYEILESICVGGIGAVYKARDTRLDDDERILFWVLRGDIEGGQLMIAPAAGGRPLPVDAGADGSSDGVWSPDGTQIVYRRRVGGEHQIASVRVGTSAAPTVLTRWSVQQDVERMRVPAAWSPDGR